MATTITPNMSLIEPTPLQEPGPTWATDLNSSLTLIDAHDHSTGKGVKITPAGLSMTADLPFSASGSYYGPVSAAHYGYHAQTAPSTGTYLASTYVVAAGDLYYRNAAGTDIQLTSGNNISQTGTGAYNGFYGNYAASGPAVNAVAYYRTATASYEFNAPLGGSSITPTSYTSLAGIYGADVFITGPSNTGYTLFDTGQTTFGSTPKGGWTMSSAGFVVSNAWTLSFDLNSTTGTAYTGTYLNNVITVLQPTAGTANRFGWLVGINVPSFNSNPFSSPGGSPSNPFEVWYWNPGGGSEPQQMGLFTSLGGGTPSSGYGGQWLFVAGRAAWTSNNSISAANRASVGRIDWVWNGTPSAGQGSMRIFSSYNNAVASLPGVDVTSFPGGQAVGLLGLATTAGIITSYGSIDPATDLGYALGSASSRWNTVFTSTVSANSGLLTLTGTTGVGITANAGVIGTLTVSSTSQATNFVPSAPATVGNVGNNNLVLAWANITWNGSSWTNNGSFNVASVTSLSSYDVALTLSTGVAITSAIVAVAQNANTGGGTGDTIWASFTNTTTIVLHQGTTFTTNRGYYVAVIG